ncbi:alpha-hydroxy-acid oxidizing protein [Nocardioides sp. HDW12B]|nr:alpha-hydroxy-acid oxidizing protein [Nocardioides sp. HDW12B]
MPRLRELEERARPRLPEEVHRYFAQGAGAGLSAAEAEGSWSGHRLVPRVLRDVTHVDLSTSLLGTDVSTPVGIAPTTLQRAAHPDGEVATARAAAAEGALLVLSSNAGSTFEDVAATGVDWWLQLYVTSDRTRTTDVVQRAVDAGARAVVLTADTPVVARKEQGERSVWEVTDPSWVRRNFTEDGAEKARDLGPQDVAWLAGRFGVPVVVKGVLHPADARRAVDAGARAVWVSNHGGRQLDRAVAVAEVLAEIAAEVGGAGSEGEGAEVYADGGIRSGLDALVARGLGADAVFLGRPVLWGLAADGYDGVRHVLGAVTEDLREGLTLAGAAGWTAVTGDLLRTTTTTAAGPAPPAGTTL